jgi:N-acetylglutamate synthase
MDNITFERAGFKAWPAFKQLDDNGWISRFADGYTKRANSVTVLQPNMNSPDEQILKYEKLYNMQGLPCIFRLLSFNDNLDLENKLDSRGYTNRDHSLVLSQEMTNKQFPSLDFDAVTINEWMNYYCEFNKKDQKHCSTHLKIINNIEGKYLLSILKRNKKVVSCGLGVISNGLFGLFDIGTHPQYRRKGYGFDLINGMLQWAVQHQANTAFLQVVAENTPAVELYRKLGFTMTYEYYYKIQDIDQ